MNIPGISIDMHAGLRGAAMLLGATLACPTAMAADEPDVLSDPFIISLGTYLVNADTTLRIDGKAGDKGTSVDWDKTFGEGSLTRIRVDAQWRFAERHKLKVLWFNTERSKTRTFDREVEWGDETFPVNAKVKGDINYDIYELAYEYAFFRRDTYELSASIGAYYAGFDASLSATITDPDGTTQRNAKSDANVDLPLPVLGLRAQWALPYDLSLDLSGQWFSLSIDQYSGNLQDYRATLTWQPNKWLGLGLGFDWFQAHGDVDKGNFNGNLDWSFQGPMAYYSVSF